MLTSSPEEDTWWFSVRPGMESASPVKTTVCLLFSVLIILASFTKFSIFADSCNSDFIPVFILPCEAVGFTRSHKNPSCQASSYPSVSAPKVMQPISTLGGTTGSYK